MKNNGWIINVLLATMLVLFLSLDEGCATAADLFDNQFTQALMKGFSNADANFHLAVENGDLPPDDPIIPCFDALVGTQNPAAKPYNTSGPIEQASVAYIKANSLRNKQTAAGPNCDALIGKFVRTGLSNAPIGGGIIK